MSCFDNVTHVHFSSAHDAFLKKVSTGSCVEVIKGEIVINWDEILFHAVQALRERETLDEVFTEEVVIEQFKTNKVQYEISDLFDQDTIAMTVKEHLDIDDVYGKSDIIDYAARYLNPTEIYTSDQIKDAYHYWFGDT